MPTSAEVVAALTSVGVQVTVGSDNSWSAVFRQENGDFQTCFLLLPGDSPYFLVFCPVSPPRSLENLSETALRQIIRLASPVKLAKLEHVELEKSVGVFFATSECSIDGFTGEKLRRRMEACALLASKISPVLA